jgi:hypothetical protein
MGSLLDFLLLTLNLQSTDNITSFEELRLSFPCTSSIVPCGAPTYHAFLFVYMEHDWALCMEKVPAGLEVMVGSVAKLTGYAREWNVLREMRTKTPRLRPVIAMGEVALSPGVRLEKLTEWLEHAALQRYDFVRANCQHFCQNAQKFLMEPG